MITSTTPAVCKTAAGLVILVSAGTCSITAIQGGNASYHPAIPVTRSFTVSRAKPGSLAQSPGSPFATGTNPQAIAVADLNGDGIPDLVTANYGSSDVTVLLGNGLGGFSPAAGSPFAVGMGPKSVVVADFNGDGIPDLAVPWSFTTPYGAISSCRTGASATITRRTLANALYIEVDFAVYTANPAFSEVLALLFAAPNNNQLGAVYTPGGNLFGSSLCQNIPNLTTPGCEPDVAIAGATTVQSATLTNLPGGSDTAPSYLLTAAPVTEVTGTVASASPSFYVFQWPGGAFSATASVSGAAPGATYLFSQGTLPGCVASNSTTLSSSNNFTGAISIANLTAGQYCIGVTAGSSSDPTFTLTFQTPVNGPACFNGAASGIANIALVQLIINQSLGLNPAINDLNGDRVINIADIQLELNTALGVGCSAK